MAHLDVGDEDLGVVGGGVAVSLEKAAEIVHDVQRDAACVFVAGYSQLRVG
jgi:hypothetical protein